jgi:hypothetical protein
MATIDKKMHCPNCGLPMSYQEFEDEDGENFQWVCDGPNNNTEKKGCWNYVNLEGPLEFAETSNEQLISHLINAIIKTTEVLNYNIPMMWYKDDEYKIDDYKTEILRRMKK